MKTVELQKKKQSELLSLLADDRAKLQQLRFDLPAGKVKNVREIRRIRKEVARILTLCQKSD